MLEKVVSYDLPPFVEGNLSKESWNEKRRAEILNLFRHEVYGSMYDESSLEVAYRIACLQSKSEIMGGRVVWETIEITVRRKNIEHSFPLVMFIPKGAVEKPAPVILTLCNRSIMDVDPSRRNISSFWPAETIIARGYAAAALITHDVAPDYDENFTTKFHRLFPELINERPDDAMGAISVWAWSMSRALDCFYDDPLINSREIAVCGHSRGGKAALWCGAQDERVSMTLSSCSGCAGSAITRGKTGERVSDITRAFPYWFCKNYGKYAGREECLPLDQHFLLALIAPRLLYISSKSDDAWCDPAAEFASAKAASAVYEVYGKSGLPVGEMPQCEQPVQSGNIAYHVKTGQHNLDEYDWNCYLDFCDKHFHPI
jgi:hypothetical protein